MMTQQDTQHLPSSAVRLCGVAIVCCVLLGCGTAVDSVRDAATFDATNPSAARDGAAQLPTGENSAPWFVDGGIMGELDAGTADRTVRARWTTYGFDPDNTQYNPDENVLNATNVAGLREKWRLRIPDGATSTPAIYDGVAYFGGWDGNVWAVDAVSGEIRWQTRATFAAVRSSPLVTDDRVFVTGVASLFALDRASGALLFETRVNEHALAFVDASPKLVDGMLIIGAASFANALPFTDESNPDLQPFVGSVVAIDAESGALLWQVATTGDGPGPCRGGSGAPVWSSAAIDEQLGLAYIGTGQGYEVPASTCSDALLAIHYARDHQGERIAWLVQFTKDDVYGLSTLLTGPDADIGASPNLFEANGKALVGVGDKGGSYRVFERSTGTLVWRKNLTVGKETLGGVMTTAAVKDETLYVASNNLETSEFAKSGVDDPRDVSTLYALDIATGQERWTLELPAPMVGSFAIASDVLYHPIVNGMFYARELATGKELWSVKLEADPGAGPSVVDGRLYVSAGMAISGTTTESGGFVASFGLGAEQVRVREAQVDELPPLSESECKAAMPTDYTAECAACVCACDATAAGHCGACWSVAPCTTLFCSFSASDEERRACMEESCGVKLLPTFVFERAVDVAPCAIECALPCGLWL